MFLILFQKCSTVLIYNFGLFGQDWCFSSSHLSMICFDSLRIIKTKHSQVIENCNNECPGLCQNSTFLNLKKPTLGHTLLISRFEHVRFLLSLLVHIFEQSTHVRFLLCFCYCLHYASALFVLRVENAFLFL